MSRGHANYTGEVRVSYDACGVYVLQYPSGSTFRSFEHLLAAFDPQFGLNGRVRGFDFNHDSDSVRLTAVNLKPTIRTALDGTTWRRNVVFHGEVRILDECGVRISSRHVEENFLRCRREKAKEIDAHERAYTCRWRWDPSTFRRGPVPLTGYRGGRGGAFRGPAIFREQKDSDFMRFDEDCLEHGLRPRAWRRSHLPDDLWWDNWNSEQWRDRSWKRHRRRQWKE